MCGMRTDGGGGRQSAIRFVEIVVYHTGARFQATVLRDAAHQVVTTDVGGAQRAARSAAR